MSLVRSLWRGLFALLCLTGGLAGCSPATPPEATVHIEQAQLLQLPGTGLTPPPARAVLPEQAWATVALPHIADTGSRLAQVATATVTDWFQFSVPASTAATAATATAEPRYLYLPRWKTVGQLAVYADGQLLYTSGANSLHNGYLRPLMLPLNGAAGALSPSLIQLRIDRLQGSSMSLSTLWVGSYQALHWRYQLRQMLQPQMSFAAAAALLAVGVFSFYMWSRRREEVLYFLFFAITAVVFLRTLNFNLQGAFGLTTDAWLEWLAQMSLPWLLLLTHFFLDRIHGKSAGWLTGFLALLMLIFSAGMTPAATALAPQLGRAAIDFVLVLCGPAFVMTVVVALRDAKQRGSRPDGLIAGSMFVMAATTVYDLALHSGWVSPEGIFLQPFGVTLMQLVFAFILFRRYLRALREVRRANAHLAQRLAQREAELEQSYRRLLEVEQNQLLSDERQRLMEDMHDGMGASLISAIRSVERGGMPESEVTQVLKDCMDDLKLAIDSMEPVETDLLLLLATLRFRLEPRMENSNVALVWAVQELPVLAWLDPSSALHILRIVQESVANVLRHTQATEIRVATAVDGAGVRVTIEDNGQGFDVASTLALARGRGLQNQQRRSMTLGGKVAWESAPSGTRFSLWLPLVQPA